MHTELFSANVTQQESKV